MAEPVGVVSADRPRAYDVAVVGAGIVGLATAYQILNLKPELSVIVLEQEDEIGRHQTGHNSGVIHAGIYYVPGSSKAVLCREGRERLIAYCGLKDIPIDRVGKLIVAIDEPDLDRLDKIRDRGLANKVPGLEEVGPDRIGEIEPHISAIRGLWSPNTAVVDFRKVAAALGNDIRDAGGVIRLSSKVVSIEQGSRGVTIGTTAGALTARGLVSCAGLWSDRVARMGSLERSGVGKIVPFRGDFYRLKPRAAALVRGLVYPVPDPRFPFLGVHLTRTINGDVLAGPNAVLALSRSGYGRASFRARDAFDTLTYRGFLRLAARQWSFGAQEFWRAWRKDAYASQVRRFLPSVQSHELERGPSGLRAQLLDPSGELVDDFRILRSGRVVHVVNAPSPAATASLAIGETVSAEALSAIGL